MMADRLPPLLEVCGLRTYFPTPHGLVRAVDGVDMTIQPGASVGIVGESGSGKSVYSLTLMGLVPAPPALIRADQLQFEGRDLLGLKGDALRELRGNRIAMIFQDPMTSLNPFLTIGDQIAEPIRVHRGASGATAGERVLELLAEVGIPDPQQAARAYPHEFSGGMRQRAMVAMALACNPVLLIADEPTTALDVTIQAQILELMQAIRRRHGTAIILITHDLGVAAGFCEEIHVMYAGKVVEHAQTRDLFVAPAHPYTRALLASVPKLSDPTRGAFTAIQGTPPDLTRLPPGCSFAPRCQHVIERCRREIPALLPVPTSEGAAVAESAGAPRAKACFVDLV